MIKATQSEWVGRVLSGVAIIFLAADAAGKLFAPEMMIANSPPLGLPAESGFHRMLGGILTICILLYAWPRSAILGAVLITGFLGGAIATHIRIASPLFSHTLFGVYIGLFVWGGLWLRNTKLRAMFPISRGN